VSSEKLHEKFVSISEERVKLRVASFEGTGKAQHGNQFATIRENQPSI
jgi:hypothetical protein